MHTYQVSTPSNNIAMGSNSPTLDKKTVTIAKLSVEHIICCPLVPE